MSRTEEIAGEIPFFEKNGDEELAGQALLKWGYGEVIITSEALKAMEKRAEKTYQVMVRTLFSLTLGVYWDFCHLLLIRDVRN